MARWWHFHPLVWEDLRAQRRLIGLGIGCALVASLLTAATIPLTEQAMASIERASQPNAPATSRRSLLLQQLAPLLPSTPAAEAPAASASEADKSASAPGSSGKGMTASQHQALRDLLVMCLLVVVVFGIKYFFTRGQTFFITKASARLGTDLRLRLFGKLQRLPLRYYNDKRTGSIQSALTNDVNVYANAVGMVRDGIDGPFRAIAALVAIIWMQWQLALLAILFIPVLAWFVNRNGRRMKAAQAVVQDDLSDLNAMANEALQGTRVIKAFAAEQRISDLYSGLVERAFGSQIQAARRFAALRPMVEFIGAVSLAAILYICGWMAAQGMLVVSQIVALTLAMDQINQGARSFANMNNTYNQVTAAAERLQREVLEVEEEPLQSGAMQLASIKGDVEFRNVSFAYPDGTLALRDVNFTIPAGTSLALVGPSGAGKSTIADLLLRFYDPTEGQILLDGTDLRELDLAWLRQQFGVVPQQTFLFAGTIEDNLRLGAVDAPAAQVERAAAQAHVDAFVARMPDGMQTQLGERGTRLSGGEMQRLAIARALARDPKVLVMDEATSNLDAVSEKYVTEALDQVMTERTTLFIAHRLTTASRASRIAVIRRGELIEIGSHTELMAKDGVYAGMFHAFTAGAMDEVG